MPRTRMTCAVPAQLSSSATAFIAAATRGASRAGAIASTAGPAPDSTAPNAPATPAAVRSKLWRCRGRPRTSFAATQPATMAAALEPRPRATGISERWTTCRPCSCSFAAFAVARAAITTRFELPVGTPSPSPSTRTSYPLPGRTSNSASNGSASAKASKPGPRFALVAGTRTRNSTPTPRLRRARGRDRVGPFDAASFDDRCCSGRLKTPHPRTAFRHSRLRRLTKALPVRGDIAGVADRDAERVGRIPERLADLERGRFLALDAVRVDAIHERRHPVGRELPRDAKGIVERALQRQHARAEDLSLHELTQGDLALGQQHDTTQTS